MKKLIVNGIKYPRIFVKDENTIIKISDHYAQSWDTLKKADLSFTDKVEKIMRPSEKVKAKYPMSKSIIQMQYFLGHQQMSQLQNICDFEILDYLKLQIAHLKTLHNNGIIHGDITPDNILIGKRQSMKFIDFEVMQTGTKVHHDNKELHGNIPIEKLEEILKKEDKTKSLNMYIYYFCMNNFFNTYEVEHSMCLQERGHFTKVISKELKRELNAYQNNELDVQEDYYFSDIIEELNKVNENYGLTRKPL